jgi:hypothetical protein
MTENDIFTIQRNIARYEAMLKFETDGTKRLVAERLLASAKADLMLAALRALV